MFSLAPCVLPPNSNMRYKIINENPKTFALILDPGEEIAAQLKQFALEQPLKGSSFTAIGARSSVNLGWLNWETKE